MFWNVLCNHLHNYYNNNLKRVPIELHFLLFIDNYYRHVLVRYYYYHYWIVIYLTRNKALFQYDGCELKLSAFKFKSTINENLLHLQYNIMDNKLKKKKTLITLLFVEWQCAVYINYILIMHCNNRRFMYLCVKSWISNPRLKYLVYKIMLKKKNEH